MEKSVFTTAYTVFRQCLVNARLKSGLTQGQLAERLGQTQSWISKVERGERRVDIVELRELCLAMDVPFLEFMAVVDEAVGRSPK